jgi:transcriptional regulator with XRE-family HTH domain
MPDSDAVFLGKVLKKARIAAGLSQEALADEFGFERTVITKAESGYRPPSPPVAEAYARRFPELNALIEGGLIEDWADHVKQAGGASPKYFGKWADREKDATTLFYWAPVLVPGILQTESYARSLLQTIPSDEPLDARLADRMDRQQVLSRSHPPVVSVIIAEQVLHRCVGSAQIMHEQLTYMADIPYPKVVVQLIPAEVGAHPGLEGAVSIAEQDGGPTIVHLESFTAAQTTAEPDIVADVREITALVRAEALPRSASRDRIARLADELWKT